MILELVWEELVVMNVKLEQMMKVEEVVCRVVELLRLESLKQDIISKKPLINVFSM